MNSLVACLLLAAPFPCAAFAGTAPPEYDIRTAPGAGVMDAGNPLQGFALVRVGDSFRVTPLAPAGDGTRIVVASANRVCQAIPRSSTNARRWRPDPWTTSSCATIDSCR